MIIIFLLSLIFFAFLRHIGSSSSSDARGFLSLRSGSWRRVRNEHLLKNNCCAICGSVDNLTVHHIKSFSENPELELCPANLVTLCENKNLNCHFVFGHRMRWSDLNRDLESTVDFMKKFLEKS